jgi:hypothetical protein
MYVCMIMISRIKMSLKIMQFVVNRCHLMVIIWFPEIEEEEGELAEEEMVSEEELSEPELMLPPGE